MHKKRLAELSVRTNDYYNQPDQTVTIRSKLRRQREYRIQFENIKIKRNLRMLGPSLRKQEFEFQRQEHERFVDKMCQRTQKPSEYWFPDTPMPWVPKHKPIGKPRIRMDQKTVRQEPQEERAPRVEYAAPAIPICRPSHYAGGLDGDPERGEKISQRPSMLRIEPLAATGEKPVNDDVELRDLDESSVIEPSENLDGFGNISQVPDSGDVFAASVVSGSGDDSESDAPQERELDPGLGLEE
jgi:hypothetical protein